MAAKSTGRGRGAGVSQDVDEAKAPDVDPGLRAQDEAGNQAAQPEEAPAPVNATPTLDLAAVETAPAESDLDAGPYSWAEPLEAAPAEVAPAEPERAAAAAPAEVAPAEVAPAGPVASASAGPATAPVEEAPVEEAPAEEVPSADLDAGPYSFAEPPPADEPAPEEPPQIGPATSDAAATTEEPPPPAGDAPLDSASAAPPAAPPPSGSSPPVAPSAPAAPPTPPPAPAADLGGDSPAAVMTAYSDLTPTQKAENYNQLGAALDASAKVASANQQAEPVELNAVMTGEDAPAPAPPGVLPTMCDAASETRDADAPATEVAPAPEVSVPSADSIDAPALTEGSSSAAQSSQVSAALDAAPTANPGIPTSAPVPSIPVEGATNPAQVGDAATAASGEASSGLAGARQAVLDGPGPEVAHTTALDEIVVVAQVDAPQFQDLGEIADVQQYVDWNLPPAAEAQFDEDQAAMMEQATAEAQNQVAQAELDWQTGHDQIVADAQQQTTDANIDAQQQQEQAVAQARTDISAEQQRAMEGQQAAVDDALGEIESERGTTMAGVQDRLATDQSAIEGHYSSASSEAGRLVADGEARAQAEEDQARADADEDSWWDQAVNAISAAIDAVVDAICAIWEEIRNAVHALMEAAVAAAKAVIDAAVAFISEAIQAYYAVVRALIQGLLAEAFPRLAAALLAAVDAIESFLLDTVLPGIADFLKSAVDTAASWALAAFDALISTIQLGFQMAGTFLTAVVTGDWAAVADMAIRAVLAAAGIPADQFYGMFGKALEAWDQILADPGALISNSVDAMVQGFSQFGDNFLDHFLDGAVSWITGATGITLPDSFDLAGIFDLTAQILGLTPEHLEEKAREHLGDGAVDMIIKIAGYVSSFIEGGWGGLWEHIKGEMAGLFEMVVGAVASWLVEKAILVGARWIASAFSGVGLILEALIAAWQFFMWMLDQMASMFNIVNAMVDSVHDFVFGNIGPAANKIESALAGMIPVAIDLVAKLLNIGNIADKVQGIVEGVREMVDNALDVLIEKALGLFGIDSKKKKDEDGEFDGAVGEKVPFSAGGESHSLWIQTAGNDTSVMVASTPMTVADRIADWDSRVTQEPSPENGKGGPTDQAGARMHLSTARTQAGLVEKEADTTAATTDPDQKAAHDATTEQAEETLAGTLGRLFTLYADEAGPDEEAAQEVMNWIGDQVAVRGQVGADGKQANDQLIPSVKIPSYCIYLLTSDDRQKAIIRRAPAKDSKANLPEVHIDDGGHLQLGKNPTSADRAPTHDLHDIVAVEPPKLTDAGYSWRYQTKEGKWFTVVMRWNDQKQSKTKGADKIDISDLVAKNDAMVESIAGEDLELKGWAGKKGRGKQPKGGNRMGGAPKKQGMEASHLIADRFGGSAARGSSNLVAASVTYNQESMGDAEDRLSDQIDQVPDANAFRFQVDVDWAALDDASVLDGVEKVQGTVLQGIKDAAERSAAMQKSLDQWKALNKTTLSPNLQRVIETEYNVDVLDSDGGVLTSMADYAGIDYWLGLTGK